MEYQKIIDLLDNTPNQSSKFRTKNWIQINDDLPHIATAVKLNLKLQIVIYISCHNIIFF